MLLFQIWAPLTLLGIYHLNLVSWYYLFSLSMSSRTSLLVSSIYGFIILKINAHSHPERPAVENWTAVASCFILVSPTATGQHLHCYFTMPGFHGSVEWIMHALIDLGVFWLPLFGAIRNTFRYCWWSEVVFRKPLITTVGPSLLLCQSALPVICQLCNLREP